MLLLPSTQSTPTATAIDTPCAQCKTTMSSNTGNMAP